MRSSKRDGIITAALAVIASDGVEGLTFEAVAERAGLTRGGIVYHFRTREALVEGIAEHLVDAWKDELLAMLGKPVEESSPSERVVALVRAGIEGTVRPGELVFLMSGQDAATAADRAWNEFCAQWVGPPEDLTPGQRIALLAADGYWANLATGALSRNPADAASLDLLLRMAAGEAA